MSQFDIVVGKVTDGTLSVSNRRLFLRSLPLLRPDFGGLLLAPALLSDSRLCLVPLYMTAHNRPGSAEVPGHAATLMIALRRRRDPLGSPQAIHPGFMQGRPSPPPEDPHMYMLDPAYSTRGCWRVRCDIMPADKPRSTPELWLLRECKEYPHLQVHPTFYPGIFRYSGMSFATDTIPHRRAYNMKDRFLMGWRR